MKRILLTAVGAIGAAGMITMAAPASAETPATPGDINTQLGQFRDSIDPGRVVNEFLNSNCGDKLDPCHSEDANPGVLHQFDYFRQNLQKQSTTFGNSIDPTKQLKTFAESITNPSDPNAKK